MTWLTKTFVARHYETGEDYQVTYSEISTCPNCKARPSTIPTIWTLHPKEDDVYIFLFDYCSGCKSGILSEYEVMNKPTEYGNGYYPDQFQQLSFNYSVPSKFFEKEFEESICLSPQFVKIYNQAFQAESQQLDEIAGLGYRKALEF